MNLKMSEVEKRQNFAVLIQIWIRAGSYGGLNLSTSIQNLTKFLIMEMNWKKDNVGKMILSHFKDTGSSPDELLDIWTILQNEPST